MCNGVNQKDMFLELKKAVQDRFDSMIKNQTKLFTVTVDRDLIWDLYLNGFTEEVRQHHNCNCCKSFLRQFSGIIAIKDGRKICMWPDSVPDEYFQSILNIKDYIMSLPIDNIFLNDYANLGTDKNIQRLETESGKPLDIIWNHFHVKLPNQFVHKGSTSIESIQGTARDNKNVLQRSLEEFSQDSIETILELISQNSLYRGKEFEGMLQEFLKVKKVYDAYINKENFCWSKSAELSQAICRIRNTSIGTLLVNLNEGMELDAAVSAFERVVAPINYKRPTAITTPKMVAEAKKRLLELGLMDSLDRRFANQTDVPIEEILFTDRSSNTTDVFSEMSKDSPVNPKTLSKVEEITIEKFIADVLPNSKGLEVLLENGHLNNMVSLLTSVNPDSSSMFKWNNPFSWSYTGGITDSMKERVKAAGGKVDGVLRFSIEWNEDGKSICDFDAHAHEPNNTHIYFSSQYKGSGRYTTMTGNLDVDMIRPSGIGVENITWADKSKMKYGEYRFRIHNYDGRFNTGFKAQVEFDGQIFDFAKSGNVQGYTDVAVVTYDKNGFSIKSNLSNEVKLITKKQWNLNTNQFHKVKLLMLSPNHWQQKTGNKHYMFFLEGCISDESPRPFYNEFLTEELMRERKVFEVLAGKLKVEPATNQLSGIGFSETQPNHIYIRVEGSFKRVLKIKI